jgi:hypothetical protein
MPCPFESPDTLNHTIFAPFLSTLVAAAVAPSGDAWGETALIAG